MRASCGTHRTLRQISSLRDRSICKVPDKYKSLSRAPKIIMKLESRTAILSCFTVLGYRERWGRYIEVRSDATSHLVRVLPSAAGAVQYHVSFSGYAEGETKEIPLGAAQESYFRDNYHSSRTRVTDSLGNNEFPLKFGVVQAQSLPAPYTERLRFGENRVINYFADNPGFANLPDFLRRAYSADLVGAESGREVSVTPELSDTLDSLNENRVECTRNGDNLEDIRVRAQPNINGQLHHNLAIGAEFKDKARNGTCGNKKTYIVELPSDGVPTIQCVKNCGSPNQANCGGGSSDRHPGGGGGGDR